MSFIHDDFMLTNETAKKLFHDYAENLPIIDYHCHLNPQSIYENKNFRNVFDFSALTANLTAQTGVNRSNFIFTAIYISFVNSLLEEFFFRGFAFLNLKRTSSRKIAYIFSSLLFALYHIAMMVGWFGLPVLLITVAGLFIGGCIFNYLDEILE